MCLVSIELRLAYWNYKDTFWAILFIFFFSSRRRHTRWPRDWSSDVVLFRSIPGFVEASTVPGQFDIVAVWQAKTSEEIVKTSVERVSHLDGIFKSETVLAYTPVFKA